jgi:hypothetical protein
MKKTILGALFVAIATGAVGASALNDITLLGHNGLKALTEDVIAACPAAAGLTFVESGAGDNGPNGSGDGEAAMKNKFQTVAPMSRFLAAPNTCAYSPDAKEAEGLQIVIEPVSMIANSSHRAACDPDNPPSGADCQRDVSTGLRFSDSAPSSPLACGVQINDWKAVLRLIYFGLRPIDVGACRLATTTPCSSNDQCPGPGDACELHPQSTRDCTDSCRVELVENWGKVFQNACAGGNCTKLQHAFRRDDNSSASEAFRELLSVRLPRLGVDQRTDRFPFCNEYSPSLQDVAPACPPPLAGAGISGSPGLAARIYFEHYQDSDPIRRPAIGNGNLDIDLATQPSVVPTEQVASAKGNLGLVLPISVPPLTGSVTDAERHARIGNVNRAGQLVPTQYCTRGVFKNASAPLIQSVAPPSTVCAPGPAYSLCPNGDVPKGGCWDEALKVVIGGSGVCPYPVFDADGSVATSNDQDFRCINGANNRPSFSSGVNQMAPATKTACVSTAFDARVYNLHPHHKTGVYLTQRYTYLDGASEVPTVGFRPVVGAFYRIHETRTAAPGFAGCVGDSCCSSDDSAAQIGCLVGASPCSIGFADQNAANQEVQTLPDGGGTLSPRSVYASALNGIEPASNCQRSGAHPASRHLWLNTLIGFRTGGVFGDEIELARCLSGNGLDNGLSIQQVVQNAGFVAIPIGCRSFNESGAPCSDGGPTNSCTNNPPGVAALASLGDPCTTNADCASNLCDLSTGRCGL